VDPFVLAFLLHLGLEVSGEVLLQEGLTHLQVEEDGHVVVVLDFV